MKYHLNLLVRSTCLLLLATAAAITLNHFRHDRLPWRGEWARHVENRARQAGLTLVGPGTVRQALASDTSRLLDARPTVDFCAGHIPGAQSLPFELVAEMLASMQIELRPDQSFITYCARNDCDEGLELALFLRRTGYTNVTLFAGGLAEWRASGGAVDTGP
jgi:rhodanese-related sulfurtransferase